MRLFGIVIRVLRFVIIVKTLFSICSSDDLFKYHSAVCIDFKKMSLNNKTYQRVCTMGVG